jgi:DNA modification methylase
MPSTGPPVSRSGDLWLLGRHKVFCANAFAQAAYATVMGRNRAIMVFADPPYNVPIAGNVSGLGAIQHREFAMGSGEMSSAEYTAFLNTIFSLLTRFGAAGSLHFVCMDWRHLNELLAASRETYAELKALCVWVKDNGGMDSFYRSQHELVFVLKHGFERHRNNLELGRYGRNRTNAWHYPGANTFSRAGDEGNLLAKHPTIKPTALVADAIMDCTARGDIVLDPFLGSGTTVIAAERTGRRCCGIEIDPLYVDTIVRRWQALTRDTARHAVSGRSFDEVQAERKVTGEETR